MGIKTILSCDGINCSNEQIFDGPYHIIREEMKEEGWQNKKIDDEWILSCPECNMKKI